MTYEERVKKFGLPKLELDVDYIDEILYAIDMAIIGTKDPDFKREMVATKNKVEFEYDRWLEKA